MMIRHLTILFSTFQLVKVLTHGDHKSQKEAAWAVTNLTSGGTDEQIGALCEAGLDEKGEGGALKAMCDLLAQKDEKTIVVSDLFFRRVLVDVNCNLNQNSNSSTLPP